MQVLVRGSETYFVEADDVAAVLEAVRAREGAEEVLLYASGRPLEAEDSLEGVEAIDVNVPLKGGKVRLLPIEMSSPYTSCSGYLIANA